MKNLFIFGDSYSVSWEQSIERSINYNSNPHKEYSDWLGKKPTHFSDIIKDKFNIDKVYNYAIGASDNYQILESIGKHIENIKDSDYVIIGWSATHRFRFVDEHNGKLKWIRINPTSTSPILELNKGAKDYLFSQVAKRDSDITLDELINWHNFLKKSLPKNTLFWSPFVYPKSNLPFQMFSIEKENNATITLETNGEIEDGHLGNDGMIIAGNWMIKNMNKLI